MMAVDHKSVAQILAWDVGRLKQESGIVLRADKVMYVTMLKGPAGDRLGVSPVAENLVGLVLDKVALTCKESPKPAGDTPSSKGEGAEDVVERKKANEVYDKFCRIAGLRLELNYRERRVDLYYKNFRDTGSLGGFVSCSDVSTLGVRKKREQRISLGTGSATIVLEEDSKQKGQVHEDSRIQAYIIVMMFAVALTQEIPADAYPGSPNAEYEEVPGVGRRRLGLTFGTRETFVRAI
jgi:hypothetical protein